MLERNNKNPLAREQLIAWRIIWLSLVCCLIEGAVRKWIVGNDSSAVSRIAYLSKYFVMSFFLFGTPVTKSNYAPIAWPYLRRGLAFLTAGAAVSSTSGFVTTGAILTILNFLFLPVSAWMAGQRLPVDSLRRLAWWVSVMAVLMTPLVVMQFFSPPGSRINRYSTEEHLIATASVSERVRATGTFSYITGLGEFGCLAVWGGIVTFTIAGNPQGRWLGYAGLVAGLCCGLATVSRGPILISLVTLGIWAFIGGQFVRKLRIASAIVGIILCVVAFTSRWDAAAEIGLTAYQRHQGVNDSFAHRLWYQFILPLDALRIAPLGNGMGTEQRGRLSRASNSRLSTGISKSSSDWTFESPWGRTVMELGILGLVGLLITWGTAIAPWKAAYQHYRRDAIRTAIVLTGVALVMRAAAGYQFNHVSAYFFWATVACVIALGNQSRLSSERPTSLVISSNII